MKKVTSILLVLVVWSCSNNNALDTLNKKEVAHSDVKKYSTSTLVKEKFLEFYDLNLLLKNNSQFQDEIRERLKNFTLDSLSVLHLPNDSKIENIQQKGDIISISDSLQKTTLVFDVRIKDHLKKDSLLVFIFKNKIKIDSNEVFSTKVKFSSY